MDTFDFYLDSRGDLSFETASREETEQFTFNFHYATSDSLLFNFFTEIHGTKKREPGMLQFNFNTYEVLYDKKNRIITGDDYIQQAIRLQLETEIGTLRENETMGSDLYKYKHMFMDEREVINVIKECVSRAIKDIVPDAEVNVHFRATAYYDFFNAIKISVILSDKTLWFTI
jgi:phage baseplate assembly protein W